MEYLRDEIFTIIKKLSQEEIDNFINLRCEILSRQNTTKRVVGANCTASRLVLGGYDSAENNFFSENSVVCIDGGFEFTYCTTGNLSEAYRMLIEEIREKDDLDFEKTMQVVYEVVTKYFGDTSRHEERMSYYPDEDFIEDYNDRGKISDLAGKNSAMCVERAMLSHNLMKLIGVASTYKTSGILNDNNEEVHSYNVVKDNDKAYIFDSTIPKGLENGEITPLITEISPEVYEKICSRKPREGYAVEAQYFSPPSGRNRDIVYDAGHREQVERFATTSGRNQTKSVEFGK